MAHESKQVYKGKVALGTDTVLGMGTWSHSGLAREMLDDTEFGDKVKSYLPGILDGGTVSFSGKYKADDTTGQDVLRAALMNGTPISDIRFYTDASGYFMPNDSTGAGGGVPASFPISRVFVTSLDVDYSGPTGALGTISFSVQVDGVLRLN